MNEKQKSNNVVKKDEKIKKQSLNSNNINKKEINKDSIRKQKRLFQMQKRLALFHEDEIQELEPENNISIKEESSEIKNFTKNFGHIQTKNKNNFNKNNLSFNNNIYLKDNLNIEQIQHKKSNDFQNSKNYLDNIIPEKIEQELDQQNLKEEEVSLKKKNTYSNTNDEDKTSTEALFPNEYDNNRKKSKSIIHNDSLEKDAFNKIINGDMDENPNIFSGNNDNNEIIDEPNIEKEEIEFQENLFNNFNFNNIINEENNSKEENIDNDNDNSVIINETDQENNVNSNNEEDNKDINKEDSNIEINISNLDIDINDINEEENTQNEEEITMSGPNSNEFAKKYLSSKSKSFIKFNNNLTARVAADSLKNSLSYMLALCPELIGGVDKKNLIKENYADEEKGKSNNNNINKNDFLINKTFRNKEIKSPFEIKKEKENISPKTHYKNRSKIDRNTFNDIHDLDTEIKSSTKSKIKINSNKNNNFIYNNYNTNNDKYRNSTLINTENTKIKYRHQKAKSLVNNNPIESLNLNVNTKNKQHSPKQISDIFNKKSTINKINYKNIDKKRKKLNLN